MTLKFEPIYSKLGEFFRKKDIKKIIFPEMSQEEVEYAEWYVRQNKFRSEIIKESLPNGMFKVTFKKA